MGTSGLMYHNGDHKNLLNFLIHISLEIEVIFITLGKTQKVILKIVTKYELLATGFLS